MIEVIARNAKTADNNANRYRQILCIALRVLQTWKGFWVFLFHQEFE